MKEPGVKKPVERLFPFVLRSRNLIADQLNHAGLNLKTRVWVACVLIIAFASHAVGQSAIRAARSVHLSYPAPEGLWFYNEMVVEQSVNGSYFMACGWNTGYFGIQQLGRPDDKVVLFSVGPDQG